MKWWLWWELASICCACYWFAFNFLSWYLLCRPGWPSSAEIKSMYYYTTSTFSFCKILAKISREWGSGSELSTLHGLLSFSPTFSSLREHEIIPMDSIGLPLFCALSCNSSYFLLFPFCLYVHIYVHAYGRQTFMVESGGYTHTILALGRQRLKKQGQGQSGLKVHSGLAKATE